jgi:sigma-B regulation protein RsbU (phosphoserine phosphatase)
MSGPESCRLLVVDDNEMNRDMLARRLRKLGHDVAMAPDGPTALALAAERAFDLILLDIMMPGMDGYQVLERLKSDEGLRHVPVVMVSAVGETESVVRCIELGAEDYLPKPFNPVVLRARVNASLAQKRLRDEERRRARLMERELEIGRQIQSSFLPETLPRVEGWEIAALFEPARQCAGDFYDAFGLEGGRMGIVVADVCDKGVGAALFMALFRSLLRATASEPVEPGTASSKILERTVRQTNDYVATTHGSANMFATVFFGIVDLATGEIEYVNGGHEAPLVAGPSRVRVRLPPTGPALGMLSAAAYSVGREQIERGETLLAFTDGVTDARGDEGPFGEERLLAALARPHPSVRGLVEDIRGSLQAHTGGREPFDDITLLATLRA